MSVKNPRAELISDNTKRYEETNKKKGITQVRTDPYIIKGKREDLPVVRLPLDLLYYNIKNGRFAAELSERETSEGRHILPENVRDAAIIEELLLKDETKAEWLKNSIQQVGQLDPATITFDGYIVNGNRRAAVLKQLFKETGNEQYAYIDVCVLPEAVSFSDLWKFEAGAQLAIDLKVDYGPVNELLKIKEGKDYGLTDKEIAFVLGGDNTSEIIEYKLEQLRLIEDYLIYFGQDKRYSLVEKRVEHFIDIVNITKRAEWRKLNNPLKKKVLHASYHMINDARLAHMEMREVGKFIKDPESALNWANDTLKIIGIVEEDEVEPKKETLTVEPLEDEIEKLEAALRKPEPKQVEQQKLDIPKKITKKNIPPITPDSSEKREQLRDLFRSTVEKVELANQKKKPGQILKRIENNLEALNEIPVEHLKKYTDDFNRINELIKKLAERFR